MAFHDLLGKRLLVCDGAMGTQLQAAGLTADDFGGAALEGCNEWLVTTRPDVVQGVHRAYLRAGSDCFLTNTFGANRIVLAEYDLGAHAHELNVHAAALAKECAREFSDDAKPRFVLGSIGPGTKLPSLLQITPTEIFASYSEQIDGLITGGVDGILIETCQDLLHVKTVVRAANAVFTRISRRVPILVTVTIETNGTMLVGSDIAAACAALLPLGVSAIGLNCATGPDAMREHLHYLAENAPIPLMVKPNAGLPENVGGVAVYRVTPDEFARAVVDLARTFHLSIVGGCCGTTPAHIGALANAITERAVGKRMTHAVPSLASMFGAQTLDQEPPPFLIGERTNANGSKQFRDMLLADDFSGITEMATAEAQSSHAMDLCTAYVGRDESHDMRECVTRLATAISVPLVIDSTEVKVLEIALAHYGGRALINSINLEDGRGKLDTIVALAKTYGAGLIALTIDEEGMAKTIARKVAIAERIYKIVVDEFGMPPHTLLFDPLTFTLGSGDAEFFEAGVQTLEAITQIKQVLPGVRTVLGVSNISFGLSPVSRKVLTSVFLHEAVRYGLDAAIVHANAILPLAQIPAGQRDAALRLIHNDRANGDPLGAYITLFENVSAGPVETEAQTAALPLEDQLKRGIVRGEKKKMPPLLDRALETYDALTIINTILLDGMREVGELFAAGTMQLPFVLQAAEAMKAAVAHLEPHMEKSDTASKGTLVIATVKGDVHDIGKNLVDIILSNNGYRVVNLGIKVSLEQMLEAAHAANAQAIGMSGLLVKSTAIMKENLEEMQRRDLRIPVICGGAALTRRFVESDLSNAYGKTVGYGKDAFSGLHFMEAIAANGGMIASDVTIMHDPLPTPLPEREREAARSAAGEGGRPQRKKSPVPENSEVVFSDDNAAQNSNVTLDDARATSVSTTAVIHRSTIPHDNPIPTPPFWGAKTVDALALSEIFPYINPVALFKGQWQFRQGKQTKEVYEQLERDTIRPLFRTWCERVAEEKLFTPKIVYGYFPCQSEGNTLIIYDVDTPTKERVRFTFPRQPKTPHLCLADFFRPVSSGERDVIAFHVVTIGDRATQEEQKLFARGDYTDYLYLHGLAMETTEALAEYWHRQIRTELGIAGGDASEVEKLFHQGYQGSRYSFGYPACPNLEDQTQLFQLLQPERIGVRLSETFQMEPEAATSALILHHPNARYFDVR